MLELILLISTLSLALSAYVLWQLKPKSARKRARVLLDTSALMDGRINEVVKSGFVPEQLLIPRFVIAEMQLLADKADHLKRERARYGLQIVQDLQESRFVTVSIISDDIPSEKGVDEKLVKLALKLNALLFTTDYNLLKVAEIEGVRVLNINELAQNLRPSRIPGEQASIKITGKGQERGQGVGYLDDGTLVVIENAGKLHGQIVQVEFTRNLQTTAGRMMFAKAVKSRSESVSPVASATPAPQPAKQLEPRNEKVARPKRAKKGYQTKSAAEENLINTINNQG